MCSPYGFAANVNCNSAQLRGVNVFQFDVCHRLAHKRYHRHQKSFYLYVSMYWHSDFLSLPLSLALALVVAFGSNSLILVLL